MVERRRSSEGLPAAHAVIARDADGTGVGLALKRIRNHPHRARVDVVDRSPRDETLRQETTAADDGDVLAHALIEVTKRKKLETRHPRPPSNLLVGQPLETAARVVNDADLSRTEQMGGDDERADRISRGPATGVTQDMGVADLEPKGTEQVETGVHARENHQVT
jgi:hypothetical protein